MKLAIGSAQFGLNYGITNTAGQLSLGAVDQILELANLQGAGFIDTAAAYGHAEQIIGDSKYLGDLKIVSKLPALPAAKPVKPWLNQTLQTSLAALGKSEIDTLLVHHADDLFAQHADLLWNFLLEAKEQGRVKRIGFSVYTVEQTHQLLERFSPDVIQIPISLFDQHFLQSGLIEQLQQQGIAIHARSIFLQGLLLAPCDNLPSFAAILKTPLLKLDRLSLLLGTSRLALLLGFIKQISGIEAAIVGVANVEQLHQIIQAWCQPNYLEGTLAWALDNESILNPSKWPKQ